MHVGAPKTGTTLVQSLLHLNRDQLRSHGVLYPGERFDAHFLAALDLLGKRWGGLEKEAAGAWDAMVAEVNAWDGNVVITHEVLAAATARQAKRAVQALEGEVHLIYSIRDLARQIPAEWQEGVKHRRKISYAEFLTDLRSEEPQHSQAQWFWSVQDWPDVLGRWGATVPAQRTHVLTVPPPEAPRELLLTRFLDLLEIDRGWLPVPSERANPSLGGAETTVIRAINARLPARRLKGPQYRHLVRELLAHRTLAARDSDKLGVPPELEGWVQSTTRRWVQQLEERGYDVVGDLSDLAPASASWRDPDSVDAGELLDVAYDVIEALLVELAERERQDPGASRKRRRERVKHRAVALAGPRVAGAGLRAYRRLRSSRRA